MNMYKLHFYIIYMKKPIINIFISNINKKSNININKLLKILSKEELIELNNKKNYKSFYKYVYSRYMLKYCLSKIFNINIKNIIINRMSNWSLYINNKDIKKTNVSISYSNNIIICAIWINVKKLWIDVEYKKYISKKEIINLNNEILHEKEKKYHNNTLNDFLNIWTIKESFAKAIGLWLAMDFKNILIFYWKYNYLYTTINNLNEFNLNSNNLSILNFLYNEKYHISLVFYLKNFFDIYNINIHLFWSNDNINISNIYKTKNIIKINI